MLINNCLNKYMNWTSIIIFLGFWLYCRSFDNLINFVFLTFRIRPCPAQYSTTLPDNLYNCVAICYIYHVICVSCHVDWCSPEFIRDHPSYRVLSIISSEYSWEKVKTECTLVLPCALFISTVFCRSIFSVCV